MNPTAQDVHLNWGDSFTCAPDWTWDTRTTPLPDFDLWAVYEGHGVMETPQGTLRLEPGDCLVLRPRETYRFRTAPDEPLVVHVAHFDFVTGPGQVVAPPAGRLPALHRPLLDVTFFRAITGRIVRCHLDGRTADADAWLAAALLELERQDREHARAADMVDDRTRAIERAAAAIAMRPGRRWSVRELAGGCFLSPDHFSRLFKAARGVTPREFIMRHRIDAARRLLLSSSHSIGRIAELTGFSDIYHFSRQFKARTGRSPTRFRRGG